MKNTTAIIFRSAILILLGIAIGYYISNGGFSNHRLGGSANDKLSRIINLVEDNYVDTVNIDQIEGQAINNVLQNLDPHSVYLPAQQAQSINERLEGGFEGIGIEYQLLRDTLFITQVYPGGSAAKAGLAPGDKVITVDDKPFSGTKLNVKQVNNAFRGAKNTIVKLGIINISGGPLKMLKLNRGRVDLSSLDAAYMAAPGVGYVKLSKFAATTDTDFRAALRKLKTNGLEKLIVDLRGNGGGYLNAATALSDEFLPKGKLIVYTKGEHEPRTDYFATDSGMFQQGNVAVLIDEYTASASEIVSGCLQDLDRATIVGRRSFGKGLVQEQFPFNDGSAVNLTVARYYTPSGRSIQKSYKNGVDSYHNEIATRVQRGELFTAQNMMKDSAFRTASVYRTAKGKKVYSGGGIVPDIFVPADTTLNTQLVQSLNEQQLFTAYIIDKLYPAFKHYTAVDDFINHYSVSDEQVDHFITYASATIREIDPHDIVASRNSIKVLLKAYMGRFKWGDNAYYQIINTDDETLKKAVAVVNQ